MGMLDGLLQQVTSSIGGAAGQQTGLTGSLLQMLTSNPGGLQGLIQTMEQQGLGHLAQSWVGTGANLPISPQQIEGLLGNAQLQAFASQHGLNLQDVASHLAQILPAAVDHMTPNGQLPQAGGLGGLLQGFLPGGKLPGT